MCIFFYFFFRESADNVVLRKGKFEELIVGSHEIAASTAQLVAASKVRLKPVVSNYHPGIYLLEEEELSWVTHKIL